MPETLFYKVAGLRPATLLKKRLWHRCFPVNFAKFLRTPFFKEHLRATASVQNQKWCSNLISRTAERKEKYD